MSPRTEVARLTAYSHGAGCGCKIGAAELARILAGLPDQHDPRLLVGSSGHDDAAVYRLTDEIAVVHTADFFTPIVDDPREFGRIAAANALSDIYAMGARPLVAINLVAFPLNELGVDCLREILAGGADIVAEAGAVIGGGHSIDDPEPKYGLAITGMVHPDQVITNATGRAGDQIYLTKPLGVGLVTTAAKRGLADPDAIDAAVTAMTTLNSVAAEEARLAGAHAMTDVTGFGLLGHLHELALSSGLAARVEAEVVPVIEGALRLASDERCVSGGARRNERHASHFTTWSEAVRPEQRILLADPMTSGGLLVAVPKDGKAQPPGIRIGDLTPGKPGEISVA